MRKTVSRKKLLSTLANLPPCLFGMEACSGAHCWTREIRKLGHDVRIMVPKFVIPYRTGRKNHNNDAAAICEAVTRPEMRVVPVTRLNNKPYCRCVSFSVRAGFANVPA